MKYRFAEMIWYETKEAAEQDRVAVLPVATYEDHGPHLPVDTDVVLCTGICERAVARIPSEAVLAPPVPHGYSPHHMDFHGTLTIGGTPSSSMLGMSVAAWPITGSSVSLSSTVMGATPLPSISRRG